MSKHNLPAYPNATESNLTLAIAFCSEVPSITFIRAGGEWCISCGLNANFSDLGAAIILPMVLAIVPLYWAKGGEH